MIRIDSNAALINEKNDKGRTDNNAALINQNIYEGKNCVKVLYDEAFVISRLTYKLNQRLKNV